MTLRVGLTGGIGSGKSTVADMLRQAGVPVVDTDRIAHALTAPGGTALAALRVAFGPEVFDADGTLSRDRLRSLVFSHEGERQRLESILHPMIRRVAERQFQAAAVHADIVVFDVPLLVESGSWAQRVDRVLVVDCSEDTQVSRVIQRSGWSEQQVRAVIARQASRQARLAEATDVIVNDGVGLPELRARVLEVLGRWRSASASGTRSRIEPSYR